MLSDTKNTNGLASHLRDFIHFVRRRGFPISIQQGLDMIEVARTGIIFQKRAFYYALKAVCCIDKDQIPQFDELFRIFWFGGEDSESVGKGKMKIEEIQNLPKKHGTLTIWGYGGSNQEGDHLAKTVTGANSQERLMKVDFSSLPDMETGVLDELAQRLWREMSKRLKKRLRSTKGRDVIHMRQTIRKSLEQGGDPIYLLLKQKKKRKKRLVLLLDISGSMEKYSFFLLRFIQALQMYFEKVESFAFSTRLERLTDLLQKDLVISDLQQLSSRIKDWSGGTRIGHCLGTFNETYSHRLLSSRTTLIILSDGLDTDPPGMLSRELEKISTRVKEVVWLNPLKGKPGYQPEARGMAEALPHLDHFQTAHNLESILELESLLAHA